MNARRCRFPGFFITFEGPEGAGKTTQIQWLRDHFAATGRTCLVTREPGGTPLAERLRGIVKHLDSGEQLQPETELMLIAAARCQHVHEVIRPALMRGEVVLCDRFYDSTAAYQGAGRGVSGRLIEIMRKAAVGDCTPDLTILLDLPPEVGFKRTRNRLETAGKFDRFEAEQLAFHTRVRQEFLAIAEREPERVRVVAADRTPEEVFAAIRSLLNHVEI